MSELDDSPAGTITKVIVDPEAIPYCWLCGAYHFYFDCRLQDRASSNQVDEQTMNEGFIDLFRKEYLERVSLGIDELIDGYPYESIFKKNNSIFDGE